MGGIYHHHNLIHNMTILKYTLAMLLLGLLPFFAQAQDYYIQKDDAGLNTAPYQDSLEQHAKDLVFAIPEGPLRDAFRVYGFGFYQNSEVTDGYPAAFEKMRTQIASETPYYLIFGKQTDKSGVYTRFWVDVKLPEGGAFNCQSVSFRLIITEKIRHRVEDIYDQNGRSSIFYQQAEIAGMRELIRLMNNIKNGQCCDIEADEIHEVLIGMGFAGFPCVISNQLGTRSGQSQNPYIVIKDYANLDFDMKGISINSNQILSDLLANLLVQGVSGNGYITKNETFCDNNKFDEVMVGYEISLNDYDVWYHIWDNPNEGEDDIVFVKSEMFDEIQSLVSVKDLSVNDGNFEWLDKETLRDYVKNNYCVGCSSGELEDMVGTRFEEVWHVYAISNFNIFGWGYSRNSESFLGDRNTVPDGISNAICGQGTSLTIYPNSRWYEVKAKDGKVYNSTSSGQIGSHIIAMRNSLLIQPARIANCAKLSLVTTSNSSIAASVYKKGTTNKIEVNHWYPQYFIDNLGRMKVQFKLYLPCFFGLGEYQVPTQVINPSIL